jgi:hypothetical protein
MEVFRWKSHVLGIATSLLVTGAAIAVFTSMYLSSRYGVEIGWKDEIALSGLQALPYIMCGALWLPRRSDAAKVGALQLATALMLCALLLYVPMLVHPNSQRGDMSVLDWVLISGVEVIGVVVVSAFMAMEIKRRESCH